MTEKVSPGVRPAKDGSNFHLHQVEKSAFASDKTVRTMMKQIEDLYASVFGMSRFHPSGRYD